MLKLQFDPVLTQPRIEQNLGKATNHQHSTGGRHAADRHVHIATHKSLDHHALVNCWAKSWSIHLKDVFNIIIPDKVLREGDGDGLSQVHFEVGLCIEWEDVKRVERV